ncbi:type II secretory pathway protein [Nibricoccus aquaticus]|uniref:Type II secretory pathway protein n=1 Tax=Nibricoccus aquaticus TaxID=2576891 RepID=A0A290QC81_9BACT|nr:type II secretion system F family protein [Nibricoccus aquaticus]ATC62938.1 type II secretory pathway protein [Nibricoccus aquaticus]
MPLSHKKLSAWYHLLAQNLDAGLPFSAALRASIGNGAPASALLRMAEITELGGSIDDALRSTGSWLPASDRLFISAGAETGRLPRVLRNLSTRHAQFSAVKTRLLLACAYPLAVLHLGLLLFPLLRMIDWEKGFLWNASAYVTTLACTLLPLWLAITTLLVLSRRQSPLLFQLARLLPAFRGYATSQALADLAFALGNFLEAGLRIDHAWQAAGTITPSPALRTAARAIDAVIARGEQPGPHLPQHPCFPADFTALYRTGELTGQLEQNLLRLAEQNQERADTSLKVASLLYPALLFIAVVILVGYHAVSFYSGYIKMLESLATT